MICFLFDRAKAYLRQFLAEKKKNNEYDLHQFVFPSHLHYISLGRFSLKIFIQLQVNQFINS